MGQIGTIVGAGAGFLIGGPLGAQIGAMVGGMVGNALGPATDGPRLSDLTVSTSTYGNAIARLFGTARLNTNMIWSGGIKEHKKTTGGLGGKGGPKQNNYTYTCSFAVAPCVGPVDGILRIWADSKLIYGEEIKFGDIKPGDPNFLAYVYKRLTLGKSKKSLKFRVYRGTEDQLPDSIIAADKGLDNTPAYRGLCYIVFEDFALEDYGNRVPQITVEVTKAKTKNHPFVPLTDLSGDPMTTGVMYPDYDNDTIWVRESDRFRAFNMTTMAEMPTGIPSEPIFPGSTGFYSYLPGLNMYFYKLGISNTVPIAYTIPGGSGFVKLGNIEANFFSEEPIGTCGGTWPDPTWIANGELGSLRVKGQACVVNLSGFGSGSIYLVAGTKPVFVDFCPPVGKFLRMGEYGGRSEFCLWAKTNAKMFFRIYSINGKAAAHWIEFPAVTPCGDTWRNHYAAQGGAEFRDISIQVPSRLNPGAQLDISQFDTCVWDASDNGLMVFGTDIEGHRFIGKYLVDEDSWKFIVDAPTDLPIAPNDLGKYTRLEGGRLAYGGNFPSRVAYINAQTGVVEDLAFLGGYNWSTAFWDDRTNSLFHYYEVTPGDRRLNRVLQGSTSETVSVASIIEEICADTNLLTPNMYDTSALPDIPVKGYVISRECTARDVLSQLASAYFFDGIESEYTIKFIPRGLASKATITEEQMGNVSDRDVQLRETLGQEIEAPMRVTVNYLDRDRDYQTGSQFAKRITNPFKTMNSRLEAKSEFPIVMDATEAKQMADKGLKMAWNSRTSSEFVLPWKYLRLDPSDVVSITLDDGSTRDIRIAKLDTGDDLTLKMSGVSETATSYVSSVVGDAGSFPIQYPGIFPPTKLVVIATPLLRDSDASGDPTVPVTYLAAYSPSNIWGGTYVVAQGVTMVDDIAFLQVQAAAGTVVNALPATKAWASTDSTTQLIVRLIDPEAELESISYDALLAGGNAALVGKEVIQYQDADLNDDGTWTLTNILRGRRATDPWVGSHTEQETFILLRTDGSVIPVNTIKQDTIHIKAVPLGNLVENVPYATWESKNKSRMDPTPIIETITDDGTDVTVAFMPRSQRSFGIIDGTGAIPFDEHYNNDGTTTEIRYHWRCWSAVTPAEIDDFLQNIFRTTGKRGLYEAPPIDKFHGMTEGFVNKPSNSDGSLYTGAYSLTIPFTDTAVDSDDTRSFLFALCGQEFSAGGVPGEEGFYKYVLARQYETGKWDLTEYF